jgi:hypothetical protein
MQNQNFRKKVKYWRLSEKDSHNIIIWCVILVIQGVVHLLLTSVESIPWLILTIIGLILTTFGEIFVTLILLIGRKEWRNREKKRRERGIYTMPECLWDIWNIIPKDENSKPVSHTAQRGSWWKACWRQIVDFITYVPLFTQEVEELQKYLFKLQYKAIIKPDRLEVLRTQAPEAKG